jgi:uncharacterized protein (DUF1330 family)
MWFPLQVVSGRSSMANSGGGYVLRMGAPRNLRGEVTAQDILVLEEAVFELAQQIFQGNQHSRNPDLLTIKTSGIAVLCNQGYAG